MSEQQPHTTDELEHQLAETTREAHPHSPGFGVSHKFPGPDTHEGSTHEDELVEAVEAGESTTEDEGSE